jgi:hypothetical protein
VLCPGDCPGSTSTESQDSLPCITAVLKDQRPSLLGVQCLGKLLFHIFYLKIKYILFVTISDEIVNLVLVSLFQPEAEI